MSNYVPYLSSSPPPLESRGDSFDDDDFGNFSRANRSDDEPLGLSPPPERTVFERKTIERLEPPSPSRGSNSNRTDADATAVVPNGSTEDDALGNDDELASTDADEWADFSVAAPEATTDCGTHKGLANGRSFAGSENESSGTDFEPDGENAVSDVDFVARPSDDDEGHLGGDGPKTNDDDDDEFSDFTSIEADPFVEAVRPVDDDGSTTINDAEVAATNVEFQSDFEAEFDDEFGTFSSASSQPLSQGVQDASNLEDTLSNVFPIHSTMLEEYDVVDLENTLSRSDASSSLQTDLWLKLSDCEKTEALTYHWTHSSTNKKLLKALNIDSRNLLFGHNWNSSIPIFAANLSFNPLEPIKTPWKSEDRPDSQACSTEQNYKAVNSEDGKEIIPPAQFDWNSSGLINPLDGLENELLGPNADNQGCESGQIASKMSPLLEQILSNAKLSADDVFKRKESRAISAEAESIIRRLPDLNFMQAKVLMFPIRSVSP